jgi:hypothetical protein
MAAPAAPAAADAGSKPADQQQAGLSVQLAVRDDGSGLDLTIAVPPPAAAAPAVAAAARAGAGAGARPRFGAGAAAPSGVTRIGGVNRVGGAAPGGGSSTPWSLPTTGAPALTGAALRAQRAADSVQVNEEEEPRRATKGKRVSWQPEGRLESLRWFKREDAPQSVGGRTDGDGAPCFRPSHSGF